MVALKPSTLGIGTSSTRRKQERRGGIETILLGPAGKREPAKQERRGGIETGSRCRPPIGSPGKQESYGGIETPGLPPGGGREHPEAGML